MDNHTHPKYPYNKAFIFPPPRIEVDPSSISISKPTHPSYVKVLQMHYTESGIKKRWEILESKDSVCILIYDKDLHSFILVRQFRPAVFFSNQKNLELSHTYELCAGLVDKPNKSIKEIAYEEVLEECGYKCKNLIPIQSFLGNTGSSGSIQHLFYTEVTQKEKHTKGGGVEDECIEVLSLPYENSLDFILNPNIKKTTSLFLAIHWYHYTFKKGNS